MSKRIKIINKGEKEIIYLDFSNYDTKSKADLISNLEEANEFISKKPEKSCLIITDFQNTGFDKDIMNRVKNFTANNTPYIKASALVGITGLQKIALSAVKSATKRDFYLAKDSDDAVDWLVSQ